MEQALRQRAAELNACRADYDDLYEKFKQSNLLFDEKERLYKAKIREQQAVIEDLAGKNAQLSRSVQGYKESQKVLQQDAQQLGEVARLIEERERQASQLLARSQRANSALAAEVKDLSERNQLLMEERSELVSKVLHDQIVEDNKILKRRMLNDMVDLKEHEALQAKYQTLERRLPFDFVTRDEYEKLQQAHYQLMDEKRLMEESMQLVEEVRESNLKACSEADAKIKFLKSRVEQTEHELQSLQRQYEQLHAQLDSVSAELQRTEDSRKELSEKLKVSESSRGQLQALVLQSRLTARQEHEGKQQALLAKQELEQAIEQARVASAQQLLESNQSMLQVFEQTEEKLRNRIISLEADLAAQQTTMESLQQELHLQRDFLRSREQDVVGAKSQLQVALLQLEAVKQEREEARFSAGKLAEEKDLLRQQGTHMQRDIDELKALLLTEYQPRSTATPATTALFSTQSSFALSPPLPPPLLSSAGTPSAGRTEPPPRGLPSSAAGRECDEEAVVLSSPPLPLRPPSPSLARSPPSGHAWPSPASASPQILTSPRRGASPLRSQAVNGHGRVTSTSPARRVPPATSFSTSLHLPTPPRPSSPAQGAASPVQTAAGSPLRSPGGGADRTRGGVQEGGREGGGQPLRASATRRIPASAMSGTGSVRGLAGMLSTSGGAKALSGPNGQSQAGGGEEDSLALDGHELVQSYASHVYNGMASPSRH